MQRLNEVYIVFRIIAFLHVRVTQIPASILTLLICSSVLLTGQSVLSKYTYDEGHVVLTDDIQIPRIARGYSVWYPESPPAHGLIVFFHPRMDTTGVEPVIEYAAEAGIAIAFLNTSNPVEFLFSEESKHFLLASIHEIVRTLSIPESHILYAGMSLAGTRALIMASYRSLDEALPSITPKAVAVCDAPLDMERFYHSSVRGMKLNAHPLSANEGKWVSGYLDRNLGPIHQNLSSYHDYSPYARNSTIPVDPLLKEIHLRTYTEPDIAWWIETRRKDLYDMNTIDMAGIINELKILGSDHAELILTKAKGYLPDGQRHPHSWSIVDEKKLVQWFSSLLEK